METSDPSKIDAYANEYSNAYKIPHYGVLGAVENLLSTDGTTESDLNYVIIYDLGFNLETMETKNYLPWISIGSKKESSSGFATSNVGFNGVIVSNRGIEFMEKETGAVIATEPEGEATEASAEICTVSGLSKEGLFANVHDAYIGSIDLGQFDGLEKSGALATNLTGTTTLNTISFNGNSKVLGSGYIGGLFGLISVEESETATISEPVDPTADLTILNLSTYGEGPNIVGGFAGLIAGKAERGVIGIHVGDYSVMFNSPNIQFAGGLIGVIAKKEEVSEPVISSDGGEEPEPSYDVVINTLSKEGVSNKYINVILNDSTLNNTNEGFKLGGIVGKLDNAVVQMCTNNGKVYNAGNSNVLATGSTGYIGGIVGYSAGYIYETINTAEVHGYDAVFAPSDVSGVGGIVGHVTNGQVINALNNGLVNGTTSNSTGLIVGSISTNYVGVLVMTYSDATKQVAGADDANRLYIGTSDVTGNQIGATSVLQETDLIYTDNSVWSRVSGVLTLNNNIPADYKEEHVVSNAFTITNVLIHTAITTA